MSIAAVACAQPRGPDDVIDVMVAADASDPRDMAADAIALDALDTAPSDTGPTVDTGPTPRVLFVRNSYTSVNDLPAVVRALAAATPGAALSIDAQRTSSAPIHSNPRLRSR